MDLGGSLGRPTRKWAPNRGAGLAETGDNPLRPCVGSKGSGFSLHVRTQKYVGRVDGLVAAFPVLVAALLGGCSKPPAPPFPAGQEPVAIIDGTPIPQSRFVAEYLRRNGPTGSALSKEQVLSDLVDVEAAYLKATKAGFTDQPAIQQAIRALVVARYRESKEADLAPTNSITDARVRAFYAANTNQFVRPPSVNLALLKIECPRKATDEKKAEALQKATALRAQAQALSKASPHFGNLAAENSADQPTRYRGGELGWMTPAVLATSLPGNVATAGLALTEPGQISEPIPGPDGFYLLKLIARRGEQRRPLDEVRPQIEHQFALQAQEDREKRWSQFSREGLEIQVHPELLAHLPTNAPPNQTPAPPTAMPNR